MSTINISQAEGPVLNWLVAKCESETTAYEQYSDAAEKFRRMHEAGCHNFSTDWSQGGPIIEREGITVLFHDRGQWSASNLNGTICAEGSTPLIAAMRCYVTSKLGGVVEVPEELI